MDPKEIVFNRKLAVDVMGLEGNYVLHVVDTHKYFMNAAVTSSKCAEYI